MIIVMPTLLFIGLTNIMGIQMLIPIGRENAVMISTFAGAIVDLMLNFIFIPKLGSAGAAIGTLVAEFVVLIVQLIYLRKDIKYLYSKQKYMIIIIALLISSGGAFIIKRIDMGIFVKLVCSCIVFFSIYIIALYVMKEEFVCENVNRVVNKLNKIKKR